jgi:CRP-like cAMP-binding protein
VRFDVAVNIQALGPGDAFGWSALLPHQDTLFQVRARERCAALRLDGGRLSAAFRKDSKFAADMLFLTLGLVAGRMQATETRLGEMCGVSVKKKDAQSPLQRLNKLIEVCLDGELGYLTAAEHIHDAKLRVVLSDFAIKRWEFAQELRAEVP